MRWNYLSLLPLLLVAACAATKPDTHLPPTSAAADAAPALTSGLEALSSIPLSELEKRVAAGDIKATVELGSRYGTGHGVAQNYDRALEYLNAAAARNDPDAEFFIGTAYSNGTGVDRNETVAIMWYEKAAAQGHAPAEYWLAVRIANGVGGVSASWSGAVPYLMDSAAKGYAPAEFMLGYAYQMGKGVELNPRLAAYWYRRTDSRQTNPKAEANLQLMIERGQITWEPGDPGKAPQSATPSEPAEQPDTVK